MKAIALISGGLDSALAAKIIKLQGIDVFGVAFITSFTHPRIGKIAQNIDIKIKPIDISLEYLDLVKNPRFGFGKNMNPCIDCHIFMLKKAKELMPETKADFVISGEVLGQRPMSQNRGALIKIEKESGLEGLLLRPLSAQLLPETIPEQRDWIKRDKLFDFSGRSRKPQMRLASELGLEGFGQPAGGCLLTDPRFSRRLKDLLTYQREFNLDDIGLLKIGRHFRLSSQAKLILGRNHEENKSLAGFIQPDNLFLEPIDIPGPTGILKTKAPSQELLESSAGILARYCDQGNHEVRVSIESSRINQTICCGALKAEVLNALRI
ncbi:MAG: tRNA 4-thiouridine(8) synthase ThiI [Candidatus Omnitrophota bacterium]